MRIGAGESDIEEIKQHKWFASLDWEKYVFGFWFNSH
jgi:hypothetical protein